MKFRRRARNPTDQQCLIEEKDATAEQRSKVRRTAWKLAKGTWKALKIGFKAAATSQGFHFALEPTAVATSIVDYRSRKADEHRRQYN